MNRLRKLFATFLTLIFVGFIPPSCCLMTDCGCGDISPENFYITAIDLSSINSSYEEIDTSIYHINTEIYKTINIVEIDIVALNSDNSGFSIYSTSYACDPIPSHALNPFSEIRLIAVNSFQLDSDQDIINSGQDITNRFEISRFGSNSFKSINSFINDRLFIYRHDNFRIRLVNKPLEPTNMRLNISIQLNDGTLYEFNNEIMNVE